MSTRTDELTITFVAIPATRYPNASPQVRLIVWDAKDEETGAKTVNDIMEGDPRQMMNELLALLQDRGLLPEKFRVRK